MQTVPSRILIQVSVSISKGDNHYVIFRQVFEPRRLCKMYPFYNAVKIFLQKWHSILHLYLKTIFWMSTTWSRIFLIDVVGLCKSRYLLYAPPAYECSTRTFYRWVRSQGWSPHASGSSKNASEPAGIPFFGAPQAPGDKPNPYEEG